MSDVACCYGCFKIAPSSDIPGWLCGACREARAAAKAAKAEEN